MHLEKLLTCIALLLGLPYLVICADAQPKDLPAATGKIIGQYASTRGDLLKDELAGLMLRRLPAPADQPLLDLQIDCRVIQHWLLEQCQGDEHHDKAALILRQQQIATAGADLDDWILKTPIALNAGQRAALLKVHRLTFLLSDEKAGQKPDEVAQNLGSALLALVGTDNVKELPILRPKTPDEHSINAATSKPAIPLATITDLAAAARQANVPGALHTQLVALAAAASAVPSGKADASQDRLQKLLRDSMALVTDLNTLPLAAEVRDKAQNDLAQALVLSLDARTATMGDEKFQSIKLMRQALAGVAASKMSADLANSLAPLFSWAQANPTLSPPVLNAVQTFLEACDQFDHMGVPQPPLPPALEKARLQIVTNFTATRTRFLTEAAGIATPADTSQQIITDADELHRLVLLTQNINQVPADLAVVAVFKAGGQAALEKRIGTCATDAAGTAKTALRDQATHGLDELHKFAAALYPLTTARTDDLPADVITPKYGAALRLDPHWRKVVLQGIMTLSNSSSVDSAIYAHLQSLCDLLQLAHGLADARNMDAQAAVATGWVDWYISAGQLGRLLKPLESDLLDAFTAVAADDWTSVDRQAHALGKYVPLIQVLHSRAAHAHDCPARPVGLYGDATALLTPMEDQPFAPQRLVSMTLLLCTQFQPLSNGLEAQAIDDLRRDLLDSLAHHGGNN